MSATEPATSSTSVKPAFSPDAWAGKALLIGMVGLFVALVGFGMGIAQDEPRYVTSWLLGLAFWLSLTVGMLFLAMIWYVFDAGWPVIIRRQLEHAFASVKYLALFFVPLALIPLAAPNTGIIWEWMNPDLVVAGGYTVSEDVLYDAKAAYLNVPFFLLRAVLYFAILVGLAEYLRRASFRMEKDGDSSWVRRARVVSALGIIAAALAISFAAFDWFMSLQYHWFSTMYGVWFFAASIRGATAATILLGVILMTAGPLAGLFSRGHRYLLGCMLLAFTVFWAYITFSQYFLIYNANIPEETFWFTMRLFAKEGGLSAWGWIMMGLIFFYFLFPFLVLLFYKSKVVVNRLTFIAAWILFFHFVDLYYNIVPRKIPVEVSEYNPLGYVVTPAFGMPLGNFFDLAAIIGMGGICIWAFLKSMKKVEIIPVRDPRIKESLNWHE